MDLKLGFIQDLTSQDLHTLEINKETVILF